ncbi:hypothetical protein [Microbacterium murale]|uniref:Uncharacterized protein n=1 Tax=Microbacterium murale TaxID=1081040 RepID=A0ABU0P9J1_9MICO|nr:hypothetical protein [Microbacterium murale]MDQ0643995.1 hypothetical protein [Microbacterium murale]
MSTDITTSDTPGVARRTVLKASAWSVPVIAAAVATPLAAASTAVDLQLRGLSGDSVGALSPDGLRGYSIPIVAGMYARALGTTTPVAAGSTLTVSYDNRLMDGPSVTIDSTPGIAQAPIVNGNTTTVIFTLPAPIPAAEPGAQVMLGFDFSDRAWFEDIEPFSIMLLPPTGSDADTSNNGWTSEAEYFDTTDAALSATWRPATIVNGNGDAVACTVLETVTITANAPGDIPSGGQVTFGGPQASNEFTPPYTYVAPFTGVTVTSAQLDGVDVSSLIGTPEVSERPSITVNTAIPAGQSLVLSLAVDVISSAPGWVWQSGYVQFFGGNDRDQLNNNVQAPPA